MMPWDPPRGGQDSRIAKQNTPSLESVAGVAIRTKGKLFAHSLRLISELCSNSQPPSMNVHQR